MWLPVKVHTHVPGCSLAPDHGRDPGHYRDYGATAEVGGAIKGLSYKCGRRECRRAAYEWNGRLMVCGFQEADTEHSCSGSPQIAAWSYVLDMQGA